MRVGLPIGRALLSSGRPRGYEGTARRSTRGTQVPHFLVARLSPFGRELAEPLLKGGLMQTILIGAGDGNRTHVTSLEGSCSTIELRPH